MISLGPISGPAVRYGNLPDTVDAFGIGCGGGDDAFAVINENLHPGNAFGGTVGFESSPIDHPAMDLPGPGWGAKENKAGESRQPSLHAFLRFPLKLGRFGPNGR